MTDIDIETEEGAQQKADQAQSDAESFAVSEVESHRENETHDTAQPPQSHDNEAHDRDFVDEGEAAAAAPVQSVNGQEGDVEVEEGNEFPELIATTDTATNAFRFRVTGFVQPDPPGVTFGIWRLGEGGGLTSAHVDDVEFQNLTVGVEVGENEDGDFDYRARLMRLSD